MITDLLELMTLMPKYLYNSNLHNTLLKNSGRFKDFIGE